MRLRLFSLLAGIAFFAAACTENKDTPEDNEEDEDIRFEKPLPESDTVSVMNGVIIRPKTS
ncbi:MAG: hypothetical protein M3Q97_08880 [Bacteroidota bacterium]|nr:hypothetical protein [Bacteroidota bacterium]